MVSAIDYVENVGIYTFSFELPQGMLVGTAYESHGNGTYLNGTTINLYRTSVDIWTNENAYLGSIVVYDTWRDARDLLDAMQYMGPMWNGSLANMNNYTYNREGKKIPYIPNLHFENRTIDGKSGKIVYGPSDHPQHGYYMAVGIYILNPNDAVFIYIYGTGNEPLFFEILDTLHVGYNNEFVAPSPLPESNRNPPTPVTNSFTAPVPIAKPKPQPKTADDWYRRGKELSRGNETESIVAFNEALKLDPNNVTILLGEVDTYKYHGNDTAALSVLEQAAKTIPENKYIWFALAETLKVLLRADEAIAAYDQAISIDSNYLNAWLSKAEVLAYFFKGERDEEAFEAFDKAIEIAPNSAAIWEKKAAALFVKHRYNESYAAWDRAIELEPGNPNYKFHKQRAMDDENQSKAMRNKTQTVPSPAYVSCNTTSLNLTEALAVLHGHSSWATT
jgi:tetratricopeptide (TPR) repeat protein